MIDEQRQKWQKNQNYRLEWNWKYYLDLTRNENLKQIHILQSNYWNHLTLEKPKAKSLKI